MRRNLHSTVASQPERAVKAPDARELSAWVHEDGLKYGSGLFKLIRAVGMLEVSVMPGPTLLRGYGEPNSALWSD